PVALVAALIGGSVGAFVMHSRNPSNTTPSTSSTNGTLASADTSRNTDAQYAQYQANQATEAGQTGTEQVIPVEYNTATEQNAYKTGFADGFKACESGASGNRVASSAYSGPRVGYAQPRVVYRNAGRSYVRNSASPGVVSSGSSIYRRPRSRSFWQKHRDKLTVAAGTGGGALIGGLIGGKKGAAIGALGGAGGSALYTYKIRKRNRRY
ncbi:MAG: hypothetical protein M3Y84_08090, partial [Acidobacteriota bacterium]|nr:hypothetical protein [Acidobacteriota bacterium]